VVPVSMAAQMFRLTLSRLKRAIRLLLFPSLILDLVKELPRSRGSREVIRRLVSDALFLANHPRTSAFIAIRDFVAPSLSVLALYGLSIKNRDQADSQLQKSDESLREHFSSLKKHFSGTENILRAVRANRPIIVVSWHHSTLYETWLLYDLLPNLVVFVLASRQFENHFRQGLQDDPELGLAIMIKSLKKGFAVLVAIDGGIGTARIVDSALGQKQSFNTGWISAARLTQAVVIPAISFSPTPDEVLIELGEDLFAGQSQESLTDVELIRRAASYFEEKMKQHAPAPVNIFRIFHDDSL